jgi:hypothetical protein
VLDSRLRVKPTVSFDKAVRTLSLGVLGALCVVICGEE